MCHVRCVMCLGHLDLTGPMPRKLMSKMEMFAGATTCSSFPGGPVSSALRQPKSFRCKTYPVVNGGSGKRSVLGIHIPNERYQRSYPQSFPTIKILLIRVFSMFFLSMLSILSWVSSAFQHFSISLNELSHFLPIFPAGTDGEQLHGATA